MYVYEKACWDFDGYFIESIDQVGKKNGTLKVLNLEHGISLHLLTQFFFFFGIRVIEYELGIILFVSLF